MINQTLVEEVLRLKDAAIMFPQPPRKERVLAIMNTVLPTEKAKSHMEWWLHIMNGGNPSSIVKYVKPADKETPKRIPLTKKDKDTLRALSYKPKNTQGNAPVVFTAQAA